MLDKVVLTFKSVDETLVCDNSNESYWVVLSCGTVFIMLYMVVQTSESVSMCGWNPSVWPFKWELLSITLISRGTEYYAVQEGYNYNEVCKWN